MARRNIIALICYCIYGPPDWIKDFKDILDNETDLPPFVVEMNRQREKKEKEECERVQRLKEWVEMKEKEEEEEKEKEARVMTCYKK